MTRTIPAAPVLEVGAMTRPTLYVLTRPDGDLAVGVGPLAEALDRSSAHGAARATSGRPMADAEVTRYVQTGEVSR